MKKIQSDQTAAERYRLQMSDGTYYQPCTFFTGGNVGCSYSRKVQTSHLNLLIPFMSPTCPSSPPYSSLHTPSPPTPLYTLPPPPTPLYTLPPPPLSSLQTGMLATQMNDKVHSKELDKFCVVQVERYICNTIHERK